jgi:hypothetical protein
MFPTHFAEHMSNEDCTTNQAFFPVDSAVAHTPGLANSDGL